MSLTYDNTFVIIIFVYGFVNMLIDNYLDILDYPLTIYFKSIFNGFLYAFIYYFFEMIIYSIISPTLLFCIQILLSILMIFNIIKQIKLLYTIYHYNNYVNKINNALDDLSNKFDNIHNM